MSFTRANYDPCAYKYDLSQSLGVGRYQLDTPPVGGRCFFPDPAIRTQYSGAAACAPSELVSVDSDLMGITRRYSKCPTDQFPKNEFACDAKMLRDCDLEGAWQESTRISNPPCTLRCTGWNRWDWLPCDPQAKAIEPFERNVNTAIVFKDNHRPLIPNPMPFATNMRDVDEPTWSERWLQAGACRNETQEMVTWRTCDEVSHL